MFAQFSCSTLQKQCERRREEGDIINNPCLDWLSWKRLISGICFLIEMLPANPMRVFGLTVAVYRLFGPFSFSPLPLSSLPTPHPPSRLQPFLNRRIDDDASHFEPSDEAIGAKQNCASIFRHRRHFRSGGHSSSFAAVQMIVLFSFTHGRRLGRHLNNAGMTKSVMSIELSIALTSQSSVCRLITFHMKKSKSSLLGPVSHN